MKSIQKMSILVLLFAMLFTSCTKDNENKEPENQKFDINNPAGYLIYTKVLSGQRLFEFMPDKKIKEYYVTADGFGTRTYPYEVKGDTITLTGTTTWLAIESEKVTSNNTGYQKLALIKSPETNQLAGKTFMGTFYRPNSSILYDKYHYSFATTEKKVEVGFDVGTIERTENYSSIGNIAAWVDATSKGYVELLVLVDGKLEVRHFNAPEVQTYYGSFTQQ